MPELCRALRAPKAGAVALLALLWNLLHLKSALSIRRRFRSSTLVPPELYQQDYREFAASLDIPSAEPNSSGNTTIDSLLSRAARGSGALILRQAAVQGLGALTGLVLARISSPENFGLYAIFTFGFYLQLAFGDLGLGASLIRQPHEPTNRECRAVFTTRQLIDLLGVLLVWIASPFLVDAYGLAPEDRWSFRLLSIAVFVQSFQLIPTVRLERGLQFSRIALIDTAQAAVYSAVAILGSMHHWGSLTFALAWLSFAIVGVFLSQLLSPWKPSWEFRLRFVRARLPFALPYQSTTLVQMLRDGITPVLIGFLLGAAEVGYVNWAQMLAGIAALGVLVLQRLYFPAFARVRGDSAAVGKMVEWSLRVSHALVSPIALFTIVFAPQITAIIFGEKWLVALPLFYLFWPINLASPTVQPLTALFNALGKPKTVLVWAASLALLTWALSLLLVPRLGSIGYAISFLLSQGASLMLVPLCRREGIPFSIISAILPVWLAGTASILAIRALSAALGAPNIESFKGLFAAGVLFMATYAAALALLLQPRTHKALTTTNSHFAA